MMLYSAQGYPIVDACEKCGRDFFIEDMSYIPYTKNRLCRKCFREIRYNIFDTEDNYQVPTLEGDAKYTEEETL